MHTHTYGSRIIMILHKTEHICDDILSHYSIRIEQKDIIALGLTYGNIIPFCKTHIVVHTDQPTVIRQIRLKVFYRTILGMIVNYQYLCVNTL